LNPKMCLTVNDILYYTRRLNFLEVREKSLLTRLNWKEKIPLEEKLCMLLLRIDESEITGDILNRHVPRPGNRRMGGGTSPMPGGKGHNLK
jgi:hypothetical protein